MQIWKFMEATVSTNRSTLASFDYQLDLNDGTSGLKDTVCRSSHMFTVLVRVCTSIYTVTHAGLLNKYVSSS